MLTLLPSNRSMLDYHKEADSHDWVIKDEKQVGKINTIPVAFDDKVI